MIWYNTIKTLKNGKASGVCGWRNEELKLLPFQAIEHLSKIFGKLWQYGMSFRLMRARVAILAKCEQPRSINDGRPITILPVLYRLAAKIVFTQVVAQWAEKLPPQISGGLPGRGVRDISLLQTIQIEDSLARGNDCCGTTMDLMKAFNMVPRLPAAMLMNRMGIPWEILCILDVFAITHDSNPGVIRVHVLRVAINYRGARRLHVVHSCHDCYQYHFFLQKCLPQNYPLFLRR